MNMMFYYYCSFYFYIYEYVLYSSNSIIPSASTMSLI